MSYSCYPNELYHYGVLGMKWGVRKAKSYAYDISTHRMNKKNRAAKADYKSGKITRAQYKAIKKKNKYAKENEDIQTNIKLKGVKRKDPDKGMDSIYGSYKNKAYSEIPDYALKRGTRTAAKALGVAGAVGIGTILHNRWHKNAVAAGKEYANAIMAEDSSKFNRKIAREWVLLDTDVATKASKDARDYAKAAERHWRAGDQYFTTATKQYKQSAAYATGVGAAAAADAVRGHIKRNRTKPKKRK